MRYVFALFLVLLSLTAACASRSHVRPASQVKNPILPGYYADPEGVVYDDTVWIFPTSSLAPANRAGLEAFSSNDLVHWTHYPAILDRASFAWATHAFWAPAAVRRDDKYYLFFSANAPSKPGQGGIGVGVSDKPEGPYRDLLGKPLITEFHNGAQPIDQFVYQDKDGEWYMFYGSWRHCNMVRLNENFTGFIPFDNGDIFRDITQTDYMEGPFLFERRGVYYFMWSEDVWTSPGYRVAYAMSDSIHGPFERIGTILSQDEQIASGAGHHSVIQVGLAESDDYRIIYHRRAIGEKNLEHRVTCMEKLEFESDGKIKRVQMTK